MRGTFPDKNDAARAKSFPNRALEGGNSMQQKEKWAFTGFSAFLFLCAVINFAGGHTGAALCSLGAGAFYWMLISTQGK